MPDLPAAQGAPAAPAAPKGDGAPPPSGGMAMLFPLLLLVPFVLLMLWSGRSQAKKQKQMLESLKKGDRVLTQSGFVGKLVETDDRYAKLELAPGVKVQMLKSSLVGRDTEETAKAVEKK